MALDVDEHDRGRCYSRQCLRLPDRQLGGFFGENLDSTHVFHEIYATPLHALGTERDLARTTLKRSVPMQSRAPRTRELYRDATFFPSDIETRLY